MEQEFVLGRKTTELFTGSGLQSQEEQASLAVWEAGLTLWTLQLSKVLEGQTDRVSGKD